MILLDTNVLSELMKAAPSVLRWFSTQPATSLYTTSITQAEILHGIWLLPSRRRRSAFEAAADAMFKEDFAGCILPFGSNAAHPYARIAAVITTAVVAEGAAAGGTKARPNPSNLRGSNTRDGPGNADPNMVRPKM